MIINIAYLLMGAIIGVLVKYELDIKSKKKRIKKRAEYMKATANDSNIQQYDDILLSIKSINSSLVKMQKEIKKEV